MIFPGERKKRNWLGNHCSVCSNICACFFHICLCVWLIASSLWINTTHLNLFAKIVTMYRRLFQDYNKLLHDKLINSHPSGLFLSRSVGIVFVQGRYTQVCQLRYIFPMFRDVWNWSLHAVFESLNFSCTCIFHISYNPRPIVNIFKVWLNCY